MRGVAIFWGRPGASGWQLLASDGFSSDRRSMSELRLSRPVLATSESSFFKASFEQMFVNLILSVASVVDFATGFAVGNGWHAGRLE